MRREVAGLAGWNIKVATKGQMEQKAMRTRADGHAKDCTMKQSRQADWMQVLDSFGSLCRLMLTQTWGFVIKWKGDETISKPPEWPVAAGDDEALHRHILLKYWLKGCRSTGGSWDVTRWPTWKPQKGPKAAVTQAT